MLQSRVLHSARAPQHHRLLCIADLANVPHCQTIHARYPVAPNLTCVRMPLQAPRLRLPMASFQDAIEMASSDDEEPPGLIDAPEVQQHHGEHPEGYHHESDDDELPFLEPAAGHDMSEESDGEPEADELPALVLQDMDDEGELARAPPMPPPRQGARPRSCGPSCHAKIPPCDGLGSV